MFGSHALATSEDLVLRIELDDCAVEPSGLYFGRDGRTAWVHVQHAGGALANDLLVEITKP